MAGRRNPRAGARRCVHKRKNGSLGPASCALRLRAQGEALFLLPVTVYLILSLSKDAGSNCQPPINVISKATDSCQ